MRFGLSLLARAVIILGCSDRATSAQTPTERTEIVGAAVHHLRHQLAREWAHVSGPVLFDGRVLERRKVAHPVYKEPIEVYKLGAQRVPRAVSELLRLIPAQPGDFNTATKCASNDLRTCTLGNAVAVFAASDPNIRGDTAEVVISGKWRSNLEKMPVSTGRIAVILLRTADGWKARETRTLLIS